MAPQTFSTLRGDFVRVGTGSSFLLDAAGEKFAGVFQVPKTGNIDRIGFLTGSVTSSQTLRVTLQTLSSGDPTGTLVGSSVKGTQTSPAASTFYEVTLGAVAAVTQGDFVAAVVEFDGTAGNLNIQCSQLYQARLFPYCDHFTAAWSKQDRCPIFSIRYDDGTYADILGMPAASFPSTAYNSGSTPDERALYFSVPFPTRCTGASLRMGCSGTSANFDVILYDSDGTTTLASTSVLATNQRTTGGFDPCEYLFTSSATLYANTNYRISVKPTSANNVTLQEFTVNAAGMLDGVPGGSNWHLSTRTDAGAWSQTTTRRPYITPMLNLFQDGSPIILCE